MYPNRPFSIRQPQGLISGFSRAGALSVKAGSSCVNPVSDAKPHLNPRPSQILRQDLQCVSFHYRKARLRETSWRPYIRNGEFHVGTEDLLQTPSIRRSPKKRRNNRSVSLHDTTGQRDSRRPPFVGPTCQSARQLARTGKESNGAGSDPHVSVRYPVIQAVALATIDCADLGSYIFSLMNSPGIRPVNAYEIPNKAIPAPIE